MRFAFSAVDRFQTLGLIEVNLRPILALQVVPGGRHTILISMGVGTKKILVWISKDLRGAKWAGASSLPKKLCGKIGVGGRHRPGGGIAQGGGIAKKKTQKQWASIAIYYSWYLDSDKLIPPTLQGNVFLSTLYTSTFTSRSFAAMSAIYWL